VSELYLIARVAGRGVVLPTDRVESVVDIAEVVPVPRADPAVRGLAALRSRVVTVIDTGRALGEAPLSGTRAVITPVDGHHYAMLVDGLEDVAPLDPQPLPSGLALSGGWREAALGIAERDGEMLLVLDLPALVPLARPTAA
jgi:purine-binding chemotaxis protein CheW